MTEIEKPLPEDFYDVPGWFDSLIQFYSEEHKKLERDVLAMPLTVLTAAIGNVIHIYGNFTDDVLKLLEQTVNPLFEPGEYKAKVYETLKVGAVNENNPAIDKMAESLMFIRSLFERDKLMLSKFFNEEIGKISDAAEITQKEEKFAEALRLITKVHVLQVINMIKGRS
jgi:hypothetical protein